MERIMEILQTKPLKLALKDIVKKVKKCTDREINKSMLQFFVDFLHKDYEITDEDMEEIDEDGFKQIILSVYGSDVLTYNTLAEEISYDNFIDSFLTELLVADKLDSTLIATWVDFFVTIIEEDTIPEVARIKAKSQMMLSFMLPKLTSLLNLSELADLNIKEDLKAAVSEAIEKIMKNIEISFRYETFAAECVTHLMMAIKDQPTHFIKDSDGLKLFRTLLGFDDRKLLVSALTTLAELCEVEAIQNALKDFFFGEIEEGDEKLVDLIMQLNHKNLKPQVIQLCNGLALIEKDFLNEDQRLELLSNVFGKNKKINTDIASLMIAIKADFWLDIIQLINFYMDPKEVDISYIITEFADTFDASPKNFLKITCEHLGDGPTSKRASQMYSIALKQNPNASEILSNVFQALKLCESNSGVIIVILSLIEDVSQEAFEKHYKDKSDELRIIDIVIKIFNETKDPMLEHLIVNILYRFFKVSICLVLPHLIKLTNHYSKLYETDAMNDNSRFEDIITVNNKLSALMECQYWRIMKDETIEKFYDYSVVTVKTEKYDYPIHPHLMRFHVNLLKHIWVMLTKDKPIPIGTNEVIENVKICKTTLEKTINDEKYPYEGKCLALASLMELLVMFQPTSHEKFSSQVFKKFHLPLTKKDMLDIVDTIDLLVFNSYMTDSNKHYYKLVVMHAFESLYMNYKNLPSLTAWEVLLRHYATNDIFKTEIEHIMEHALTLEKAGIYDKTVAFTILNIATEYNLQKFRDFFHAIETFLKKHQPDVKERQKRFATICSYVLEKLPKFLSNNQEVDKRLIVLDCLRIIIKNLETTYKKNLSEFIRLNNVKLTVSEKTKVDAFINMLKE